MKNATEYTIFDAVTPVAVTSSTDATPIVVTATTHGLVTGDSVIIYGHTTNIAANGIFLVEKVNANSFKLKDINTGADVAGSGAGAGASGVLTKGPKVLLVEDYMNVILSVFTSGSFNGTLKIAGSVGKSLNDKSSHGDTPNFGATVSKSNPYSFLQIIPLTSGTAVAGGTGITSAGTDIVENYEVNINGIKYICVVPTAWSAGVLEIKALLLDNG